MTKTRKAPEGAKPAARHVTKWTEQFYIGTHNGERIYLSPPSWDCGWYWGFGYLGNRNCHYHLSGVDEGKNINLYDALKQHFQDFQIDDKKLWTFCELVRSAYTLKEAAEVLGRGGSHYTTNPCADTIKSEAETARINEIVLPAIFDAIADLLFPAQEQTPA